MIGIAFILRREEHTPTRVDPFEGQRRTAFKRSIEGLFPAIVWAAALSAAAPPAHAQVNTSITPTTGVGNLGTTVTPNGSTYNIGGGTRPNAGPNLFHSFGEFSIGAGDTANFTNATPALPTSNILSRVTGGNPSNIFGTIQTTEFPGANLFLMNPAGIVFGPTAQLNVSGAVNFTTADYLRLADHGGGNAGILYANPLASSVLSTAPVVAFGFLTSSPAPITVQGSSLIMPPGQTLSLVGGDVTIGADPESGTGALVQAPGGKIQIVSVASPGEVLSPSLEFGPNVNGQSFTTLGTITMKEGTFIDVSDGGFIGDGSAGSIAIRGGRLVMDSSFMGADHFADSDAPSPAIKLTLDGDIQLSNLSLLFSEGFALGRSGDIDISARNILLTDGSFIAVAAFGTGPAGAIKIRASESVTLQGFIDPSNVSKVLAIGGPVSIETPSLVLDNLAAIESTAGGTPQVRDIDIGVTNLTLKNGGVITFSGDAQTPGRITINAQDSVTITGIGEGFGPSPSGIFMSDVSGGGVTINARNVTLSDGGHIEARNNEPGQDRVTLTVRASENLSLLGNGQSFFEGTFISTTGLQSPAGVIDFSARNISLTDGATMFSQSGASEAAGVVRLQAETISLTNQSRIGTNSAGGSGPGGPIDIIAQNSLTMSGGSILESNSFASGPAGSVTVNSGNLLSLSGSGTVIRTEARNVGDGGAISITSPTVQIADLASVSARTIASGNAGTVTIAGNSVTFSGGARADTSTSGSGQGGNVTVQGLASPAQSVLIEGPGTGVFTNTTGTETGGNININAQTMTLQNQGTLSAATSGTALSATGGTITVNANNFQVNSQGLITSGTTGPAKAGNVNLTASNASLSNGGQIQANTSGAGAGGSVTLTSSGAVSLSGGGTSVSSTANNTGHGGTISIQSGALTLSDSALISAASTGTAPGSGNAGTINIQTPGNFVMNGGSVTTSAAQGQGGDINITAGQQVQMNNNAVISASSDGSGNAGNIAVTAGDSILLSASSIITEAKQASGGNITLMSPNFLQLDNSVVSSSVQGGANTVGGNITIDPQYVVLQNSQIIAQAFQGQGGNINITAGVLLVDGTSVIDASSQFGVNGTVNIQSPISNLSQAVNPLQRSTLQAAALLRERCAVRAQSGGLSSLTVRSRDIAPIAPGGMLSGPLIPIGPSPAASGATPSAVGDSVMLKPALLEVSGELLRPMGGKLGGQLGGCGS